MVMNYFVFNVLTTWWTNSRVDDYSRRHDVYISSRYVSIPYGILNISEIVHAYIYIIYELIWKSYANREYIT